MTLEEIQQIEGIDANAVEDIRTAVLNYYGHMAASAGAAPETVAPETAALETAAPETAAAETAVQAPAQAPQPPESAPPADLQHAEPLQVESGNIKNPETGLEGE